MILICSRKSFGDCWAQCECKNWLAFRLDMTITTITHIRQRVETVFAIHFDSHLPNLYQNWSATKKVQLSSQQRWTMNTALSLRWMWPSPSVKEVTVRFWIRTTALCAFLRRIILRSCSTGDVARTKARAAESVGVSRFRQWKERRTR